MGRKKKTKIHRLFNLRLPLETNKRLDTYLAKMNLLPSHFLHQAIVDELDQAFYLDVSLPNLQRALDAVTKKQLFLQHLIRQLYSDN